jgi:hypothetical protein
MKKIKILSLAEIIKRAKEIDYSKIRTKHLCNELPTKRIKRPKGFKFNVGCMPDRFK